MVMFKGVSHAAPLAGDGLSGMTGVELNVDLWVSCSDLSSSLGYYIVTRQRTVAESE
jgi:hypothetical protein